MFHLLTHTAQHSTQPALRAVTNRIEAIGGVNMSQGKCALPVHSLVKEASIRAVKEGGTLRPCEMVHPSPTRSHPED